MSVWFFLQMAGAGIGLALGSWWINRKRND